MVLRALQAVSVHCSCSAGLGPLRARDSRSAGHPYVSKVSQSRKGEPEAAQVPLATRAEYEGRPHEPHWLGRLGG